MVHQAGQDAVQVEAAADVARDASERLRAMEQVRDLLLAATDRDDRAEGIGDDASQVEVDRSERVRAVGDDEQHAPGSILAADGDGQLRARPGQAGEGHPVGRVGEDGNGPRRSARAVGRVGSRAPNRGRGPGPRIPAADRAVADRSCRAAGPTPGRRGGPRGPPRSRPSGGLRSRGRASRCGKGPRRRRRRTRADRAISSRSRRSPRCRRLAASIAASTAAWLVA